jgi:hypothetical protein
LAGQHLENSHQASLTSVGDLSLWFDYSDSLLLTFTCFRDTLFHVEVVMETQNITLSIPKEVLRKVKLIAVQRGTSVSGLLTKTLEKLVDQEDGYAHAQRRHLHWLEQGADLGTGGQAVSRRDELHERA